MIFNLFKNLFRRAETLAEIAEENSNSYTDESFALKGCDINLTSGTLTSNQLAVLGRLVFGIVKMSLTATRNTWTVIGNIEHTPADTLQFPMYSLAYGRWSGLFRIDANGTVFVYPYENTLNNEVVCAEITFFKVGGVILNLLSALLERGCMA